jgi:hypothetical protein
METTRESKSPGHLPGRVPENISQAAQGFHTLVEKCAIPLAACITLITLLRSIALSSRRLWFDEIYTSTVALQPTLRGVWEAYAAAVDFQPLLFSYVTRLSCLLLGRNEVALRMPQILGVLVFSWCLFYFVRKRVGSVFGLSAMILPLVTNLVFYAGQARPYGMLLGACGLALLAWRNAVGDQRRRTALPLFALSLAGIAACHAYAIVAVFAFALAELFRCFGRKRADWRVWICFFAVVPPLVLYWFPMHAVKVSGRVVLGPTKWVHWGNIPAFYEFFFRHRELLLISTIALFAGLVLLRVRPQPPVGGMPSHEVVLMVALAVSPAFSVILAMLVTKFYVVRYSIFALAGVVVLAILAIDWVAPDRRVASGMLLVVSIALFGLEQMRPAFSMEGMKKRDAGLEVPFHLLPANTPLVIASGLALLPTDIYASDADLANTYYLMDRAADIQYTGSTIFDFGPPFTDYYHFRTHLVDYSTFIATHKRFMVYGPYNYEDDWQVRKLKDDGAKFVEKGKYSGENSDNYLLEVRLP